MSKLERLRRLGRRLTGAPAAAPVPPEPIVCSGGPMGDPEATRLRDELLSTGNFRLTSAALERAGRDWERRSVIVSAASDAAVAEPEAFAIWQRHFPRSPDVLTVTARVLTDQAWEARGSGWARQTDRSAFAEFGRLLEEADHACATAAAASPDDPTPWWIWLWVAIGREQPHEVFGARWEELRARAPFHRLGHIGLLQYTCEKWHGSHEEMFAAAREVVAYAPPRSPLKVAAVHAHHEYALVAADRDPEFSPREYWASGPARADLDAALAAWPAKAAPTPTDLHDRSILACACALAGRWEELAAIFVATGHRMFDYPWYYHSGWRELLRVAHGHAGRSIGAWGDPAPV